MIDKAMRSSIIHTHNREKRDYTHKLPLWLGGIRIQPTFALVLVVRGD